MCDKLEEVLDMNFLLSSALDSSIFMSKSTVHNVTMRIFCDWFELIMTETAPLTI